MAPQNTVPVTKKKVSKKKAAARRKAIRDALRERQAEARENELCLWCMEPTEGGKSLCPKHLEEQRERAAAKREAGICVRCRKPCGEAYACDECKAKDTERKRARRARGLKS